MEYQKVKFILQTGYTNSSEAFFYLYTFIIYAMHIEIQNGGLDMVVK